MPSSADLDPAVRLHVYERFVADGKPPSAEETAHDLGMSVEEAEESYRRLAENRVVVLAPGTTNIWMANPLSAYPTPFWVETPHGAYFGSCVWDAFGVVAMLGGTGVIATHCPDCGEAMELRVADRELEEADGITHFAVPARRWWENIGYA